MLLRLLKMAAPIIRAKSTIEEGNAMNAQEKAEQAYDNATSGSSTRNYMAIFAGFEAKGIPAEQIEPRENVLTFWAWKAVGRQVRKGEHGVKITTWIECESKRKGENTPDDETPDKDNKKRSYRRPHTTTVFHLSQTEPTKAA